MKIFKQLLLLVALTCAASAQTLLGEWKGTLSSPDCELPLVFQFAADGKGNVKSPAQANFSAPVKYSANGKQVTISVPSIRATYSATLDGGRMTGKWSQNGEEIPLTISK